MIRAPPVVVSDNVPFSVKSPFQLIVNGAGAVVDVVAGGTGGTVAGEASKKA